jgi:hypothetical protein
MKVRKQRMMIVYSQRVGSDRVPETDLIEKYTVTWMALIGALVDIMAFYWMLLLLTPARGRGVATSTGRQWTVRPVSAAQSNTRRRAAHAQNSPAIR